jgi:hypothetical protein
MRLPNVDDELQARVERVDWDLRAEAIDISNEHRKVASDIITMGTNSQYSSAKASRLKVQSQAIPLYVGVCSPTWMVLVEQRHAGNVGG